MLQTFTRSVQYAQTALKAKNVSNYTEQEKEIAEKYISEKLLGMKGFAQKIGQTLSLSELGTDKNVYSKLTEQEVVVSIEEIFKNFKHYYYDAKSIFKTISRKGISASLSQVHKAELRDSGEQVAVKIQHKNIRSILTTDIKFIDVLLKPMGHFKKDFDIASFQTELGEMVLTELNYVKEAEHLSVFNQIDLPYLHVPKPFKHVSTNEILVMEWLEGENFDYVLKNWSSKEKKELSENLVSLFLYSLFSLQRLHADPHTGNYRFNYSNQTAKIIMYDFGCVKEISNSFKSNFLSLLNKLSSGEEVDSEFFSLGFKEFSSESAMGKVSDICKVLFYPFLQNRSVSISEWSISESVEKLLGESRYEVRHSGKGELLYIIRSFQGLIKYLEVLGEKVNWNKIVQPYINEQNRRKCVS